MSRRNRLACDECNANKVKCISQAHACTRCERLGKVCIIQRSLRKRGRRPINAAPPLSPLSIVDLPDYPVLACLRFLDSPKDEISSTKPRVPVSRFSACRLLEHFYESPEQGFHAGIIRRHRLLHPNKPRVTNPILMLSFLCISCYMPSTAHCLAVLNVTSSEFVSIRRQLLSECIMRMREITDSTAVLKFDHALTALIVCSLGPTEEIIHSDLLYWLSFLKYAVRKVDLCAESETLSNEDKEERRRLWWYTYIIDRHSALSLNLRTQFTDDECRNLPMPHSDRDFLSADPLLDETSRLATYEMVQLDMLGVLVPLFRIVGNILEYQFLRRNNMFDMQSFIGAMRLGILQQLQIWLASFKRYVPPDFCEATTASPEVPTIAYYALHLFHCLHILIYGHMDLISMYEDIEWQASSDFIKAGEHALSCANIADRIISKDPELSLLRRAFGTYLLQSSFIFMILAKKLGPDELLVKKCTSNLKILEMFAETANMNYQRDFVKVLKRILSENASNAPDGLQQGLLDPEVSRYRWIAGHHGTLGGQRASDTKDKNHE